MLLMASQIDRLALLANRAKSDYVYFTNPDAAESQRVMIMTSCELHFHLF